MRTATVAPASGYATRATRIVVLIGGATASIAASFGSDGSQSCARAGIMRADRGGQSMSAGSEKDGEGIPCACGRGTLKSRSPDPNLSRKYGFLCGSCGSTADVDWRGNVTWTYESPALLEARARRNEKPPRARTFTAEEIVVVEDERNEG
jgi:hypothetical protein